VGYRVDTPVFAGPIDLLLHLVSSHELDVLDIPLAPLVDAFVAHLAEHGDELPLDTLSEFLLIAAILLEMKSQRLLPGTDDVEDDEELVGWDGRDLLLARLLECRAYSAAADAFVALMDAAARSFPREVGLDDGFVVHAPDLLAGVGRDELAAAYRRATAERPVPRVDLSHVTVDTVSVSEAVAELAELLPGRGPVTFRELTEGCTTRIDVIVRFLALLELCKMGRVTLGQGRAFGDLQIAWTGAERIPAGVAAGLLEDVDHYEG
jgi:segregation and condensation protein A